MLLRRIGDALYAELLAEHHGIIRSSLRAHDGKEVGTQGDGFFATFPSPVACVEAAIEAQRLLATKRWPAGETVRVRMGIHSGEAAETAAGPVGYDVHRAARVAAIAHGGQVVLSAAAGALVRDALPPGVVLKDLGSHRLKDLGRPEQIFQLAAEGLESEFPPLRSLDNPELPNNLPFYLSSFVGREPELAEVGALVGSLRLVTVAGAGGSGKTRLALEVAAQLVDEMGEGVWFVDLSTVSDPEQVPVAILRTLGAREEAGAPPLERLLDLLRDQRVLVVLDNCEQVIDACAKVVELIDRNCPRVRVLTTSREPLGIDGERVYRLRPLSLPDEGTSALAEIEHSDAVELFIERVRARDDSFVLSEEVAPLVASICRRLDGVPFAIELAAARLGTMSLSDLSDRLDQRFRLLTGGSRNALARQRTLQAMVDWSYDLLNETERHVLMKLSVFTGSFDLEAAEAVCKTGTSGVFETDDVLGSLVNKSLVTTERSSASLRYKLLETIRQYACDQLVATAGDAGLQQARLEHASHYLSLAEAAGPELIGSRQAVFLRRLDAEYDNIRTAFSYFSSEPGRAGDVLRMGTALASFLWSRHHIEPVAEFRAALGACGEQPDDVLAEALLAAGYMVGLLLGPVDRRDLLAGAAYAERAVELGRKIGDEAIVSESLSVLANCEYLEGRIDQSTAIGLEALSVARHLAEPRLVGLALHALAPTSSVPAELHLEALSCLRQAGDYMFVYAQLYSLASDCLASEDIAAGRAYSEEALRLAEELESGWFTVVSTGQRALYYILEGDADAAVPLCRQALRVTRRIGLPLSVANMIFLLACCATKRGDAELGARLWGAQEGWFAEGLARAPARTWTWTRPEARLRDESRSRLEASLGEDFERLYALGRSMSLDEACDLALGRALASGPHVLPAANTKS